MWEGIFLDHGCSITTENSTNIEDAETAIHSSDKFNNTFSISETTFNRNRVGIFLNRTLPFLPSSMNFAKLENNKFICTSPLNSGNNEITRAGIESVGHVLFFRSKGNIFASIEYGILGLNSLNSAFSTLIMKDEKFLNIKRDGIQLEFGAVRIQESEFVNCAENGIHISKAYNSIISNNCSFMVDNNVDVPSSFDFFSMPIIRGVNILSFSDGHFLHTRESTFTDNTTHFEDRIDGQRVRMIEINSSEIFDSEVFIFQNIFNINANSSHAIFMKGSFSTNSKIDIINNDFTFADAENSDRSVAIEIDANVNNLSIIENDFFGKSTHNNGSWGIILRGSEGLNNDVSGNAFSNDAIFSFGINRSIFMSSFDNTRYCDNTSFLPTYLFTVFGNNDNVQLLSNSSTAGLICQINGAGYFGEQIHNGNKYSPAFSGIFAFGYARQATCNEIYASLSQFEVHTEQSVDYGNGDWNEFHPRTVVPDTDDEWWYMGSGNPQGACQNQSPPPSPGNLTSLMIALERGILTSIFENENLLWQAQKQIYSDLQRNELSASDHPKLMDFIIENENSNIGIVNDVEALIDDYLVSNDLGKLQEAAELNERINAILNIEQNYKRYNRVYINLLENSTLNLSENQRDELAQIAVQCPQDGGNVVYEARRFFGECEINSLDDCYEIIDDEEPLEFIADRDNYGDQKIESLLNVNSELVYPNPATTELFLNTKKSGKVSIFNLQGLRQAEYNFSASLKIDISELEPGLYFYRMEVSDESPIVGQFIKM